MTDDLFKFRRFRLELDGLVQGAFAAMDPPGEQVLARSAPGETQGGAAAVLRTPAKLLDGIANTRDLSRWLSRALEGAVEPKEVQLVELDDDGRPVARHRFEAAWPVKLRLAPLSDAELFAVDELELSVERWSYAAAADEPEEEPPSPPKRVR